MCQDHRHWRDGWQVTVRRCTARTHCLPPLPPPPPPPIHKSACRQYNPSCAHAVPKITWLEFWFRQTLHGGSSQWEWSGSRQLINMLSSSSIVVNIVTVRMEQVTWTHQHAVFVIRRRQHRHHRHSENGAGPMNSSTCCLRLTLSSTSSPSA